MTTVNHDHRPISIVKYNLNLKNHESFVDQTLGIQRRVCVTRNDRPPTHGFLISRFSHEDLYGLLQLGSSALYIALQEIEVVGYCLVTDIHQFLDLFKDPEDGVFHFRTAVSIATLSYLYQLAILPHHSRKGIGTALLNAAKLGYPGGLLADVLLEPIRNDASLSFLYANGFKSVGKLQLSRYLDFGNLTSLVLLWKPESI